MNSEILIELAKQYRKLEAAQRAINFRRAVWARKARAQFPSDDHFIAWCRSHLGTRDEQARLLCALATAAEIVKDERTWNQLGGASQIMAVRPLNRRDQVAVLEAAKASGRGVRTIALERHPELRKERRNEQPPAAKMGDVERLSRYIAEHVGSLPPLPGDIEVLVRMYVPNLRRRAA